MKRRDALQKMMIGTGTMILIPASFISCSEDPGDMDNLPGGNGSGTKTLEINLDDAANSALKTEGGHKIINGIIIANTGGDQFVALASICTHQGCEVMFDNSDNSFPCPCHGSLFSSTGSVLQGPATRPLKKYTISKTDNILTIITG